MSYKWCLPFSRVDTYIILWGLIQWHVKLSRNWIIKWYLGVKYFCLKFLWSAINDKTRTQINLHHRLLWACDLCFYILMLLLNHWDHIFCALSWEFNSHREEEESGSFLHWYISYLEKSRPASSRKHSLNQGLWGFLYSNSL